MTTDKLLATQGYVVGVEISGSGSRLSVALADLNETPAQPAERTSRSAIEFRSSWTLQMLAIGVPVVPLV